MKNCDRCGINIQTFSPMRKWCFDCRKRVSLEQAKARKAKKAQMPPISS